MKGMVSLFFAFLFERWLIDFLWKGRDEETGANFFWLCEQPCEMASHWPWELESTKQEPASQHLPLKLISVVSTTFRIFLKRAGLQSADMSMENPASAASYLSLGYLFMLS